MIMPVFVYKAQEFETTHERQVIDEIISMLKKEYDEIGEIIILLENYICGSNQIDATIIKKDGIIVLEFKNYGGDILFSENGDWSADGNVIKGGREGRNPCQQVRAYKYGLMNFLKDHSEQILIQRREIEWGHISGMVIFHRTIKFDKNVIPISMRPWFHVTDLARSINDIKAITSNKLFLSEEELLKIPALLGLQPVEQKLQQKIDYDYIVKFDDKEEPIEIPTIHPKGSKKRKPREKQDERIIDYYLRCLELEDIKGSELRYDHNQVVKLSSEAHNLLTNPEKTIFIGKSQNFITTVTNEGMRERPRSIFFGFPVIRTSKDLLLPIFSCQLQHTSLNKGLELKRIPEEDYVISKTIFKMRGLEQEETEEAIAEIFELSTLEERLECLKTKYQIPIPLKRQAIVYLNEPSQFAHNLVDELDKLSSFSSLKALQSTPAKYLIDCECLGGKATSQSDANLIEVFRMNEAQKNSVLSSFREDVTVVTGPPGTGKSQVVLNIFANALHLGKSVLFASKNNNAVDVVNERFSKYVIDEEMLVRVGNKEQMKLIREGLKGLSNRILSGQVKTTLDEVEKAKEKCSNTAHSIDEGVVKLRDLQSFPGLIMEKETILNETIANRNDELTRLENERIKLESERDTILRGIPSQIVKIIYNDHKRFVLRRRDLERLVSRVSSLRTKKGLKIFEWMIRSIYPKRFISEIKNALLNQEKNVPVELLNWIDSKCPDNLTFESYVNRCRHLLKLADCDAGVQKVLEIEQQIGQVIADHKNKKEQYDKSEESIKLDLDDLRKRFRALQGEQKYIEEKIEKDKFENILNTRNYTNLLWKSRIANEKAGSSISTLSSYFMNPAAVSASNDVFTKAITYLPLWSVSSLSAKNGLPLKPNMFDLLVIDEAAQCDIASAVPLFFRAKKVIVIGDSMQLKHISSISEKEDEQLAKDAGCEEFARRYSKESLFDRMDYISRRSDRSVEFLAEHFRSHEKIIQFSNIYIYLPRTGRELIIKTPPTAFDSNAVLTWINIKGKIYGNSKRNKIEVKRVVEILMQVIPFAKQNNFQIGVTTPFRNQAEDIIQSIPTTYKNIVTADTVHKFQGNEKDIMIFSPVIAEGATKNMINFINIGAPQLLNVAITRARHRLIVVGDYEACVEAGGLLKRLALYIKYNGQIS